MHCESDDLHGQPQTWRARFVADLRQPAHTPPPPGGSSAHCETPTTTPIQSEQRHAFETYRSGGLTNKRRDRSADDQMTEKRKVFKTLITRWMPVRTLSVLPLTRTRQRAAGSVLLCHHWDLNSGRPSTAPAPTSTTLTTAHTKKCVFFPLYNTSCVCVRVRVRLRNEAQSLLAVDFPALRCRVFLIHSRGRRFS